MKIEFDPRKDAVNLQKHGISLGLAECLDWDTAVIWPDLRFNYGEERMSCLGYIGERLHYLAFALRQDARCIISLRKANKREEKDYASA